MGGPTEQKTNTVFIPPGEGRQTFAPSPLAWLVENLEVGHEGILESLVGPSILRIKASIFVTDTTVSADFEGRSLDSEETIVDVIGHPGSGSTAPFFGHKTGIPFSIFSTRLMGGSIAILLYRMGSRLYLFRGGSDNADEVLLSGLTVNAESPNLDQYVVINDRIVYFNGSDRPRVITYDGNVTELGFYQRAATPAVSCPSQPDYDDAVNYYPNAMGYSWQGRIGTPGDELSGQKASLLSGNWYYYFQYEDIHGNLSEFSGPSDPATIHTNQADPFYPIGTSRTGAAGDKINLLVGGEIKSGKTLPMGTEIDDLTRRFLVKAGGDLPEHAVATRIFRTADTRHKDSTPRLLARVPGSRQFYFDDNYSDSDLGAEWQETISVPVFAAACAHQGRLIIGNLPGDSGIVRRSQPGFPGTFEALDFVYPDSNGAPITALVSHNGSLIAFTEDSTYLIGVDFSDAQPISTSIGCIAPKSVQNFGDGSLVWLASDGVYALKSDRTIVKLSTSIDKVFDQELNRSQFFRAVSVIDNESREYRCAISAKGESRNTIILCFDGNYWRRQTLGIQIADMCSIKDHTHNTLAVGSDMRELDAGISSPGSPGTAPFNGRSVLSRVFIMGRQSTDYFAPPRRLRYRSAWLRSSELGLVPTNVRNLYVGLLDSWVGNATVRLYRNGSWEPVAQLDDVLLCGPDDGSGVVSESASKAVVGSARTRDPRLFWRQIPVDLQNANSWAFEIDVVGSVDPAQPDNLASAHANLRATRSWVPDTYLTDVTGLVEATRRDVKLIDRVFDQDRDSADGFIEGVLGDTNKWELGRLKIAAFAFDTSIATQGSPLGRVPKRRDT